MFAYVGSCDVPLEPIVGWLGIVMACVRDAVGHCVLFGCELLPLLPVLGDFAITLLLSRKHSEIETFV